MPPDERAARGLFLAFQYPLEIPGVATMTFLKACPQRTAQEPRRRGIDHARLRAARACRRRAARHQAGDAAPAAECRLFGRREEAHGNPADGAARTEQFTILDETDSGLDIDALRIVADGVNGLRTPERGFLVITHYQRLLDYIVPDSVHVLSKGRIVKTGGPELARELERTGYRDFVARCRVRSR